jgi:hypothetical protein
MYIKLTQNSQIKTNLPIESEIKESIRGWLVKEIKASRQSRHVNIKAKKDREK